tara:strand:+ start:225 stop:455 length:231 start_codon:yes stop_codon:yes gene_type:complete
MRKEYNLSTGAVAEYEDAPPSPQPVLTPEQVQDKTNQEALAYLASTDWWVVRYAETGTPVDSEVATKRADARLAVK